MRDRSEMKAAPADYAGAACIPAERYSCWLTGWPSAICART
jgi:hypothetical protein